MRPCCTLNRTRAIRLLGNDVHTSHKPSPSAAKRHTHWPAVLNAHEVEAHGLTVDLGQAPQPVPHDLRAALRAVKHDRYLVGAATWHYALYNVHVPYNVRSCNSNPTQA
jgi:hypothetical protein